jgi:tetratricopeptide (TPR) repeat protein/predicted Ser/Thr protein kinase
MSSQANDHSGNHEQWPEVLDACLETLESVQVTDRAELLARYPAFAEQLAQFFAQRDQIDQLAVPLRSAVQAARMRTTETPLPDGTIQEPGASTPGPRVGSAADYELLEVIARGGMGVIYKACQTRLNRTVALKMIRAGTLATPADLERFKAEAEAAAALDHPHIVPIYEVGDWPAEDGGPPMPFFSMKLIEGGNLAGHRDRWQTDVRAAVRLVIEVARAVHHAHQRGLLHRDLKPSNILLDADGRPYVIDFGLAKWAMRDRDLTASGNVVGTPRYMAPEQTQGKKGAITTATDVYGLGVILYEVLTGRPPFQGDMVQDVLEQIRTREPERLSRINPQVDRDLETICLKCLEKEAEQRYGSAEALAEDLEHWRAGEPIHARRVGWRERTWRWCRRNPMIAVPSAVAALLLTVLLVALPIGIILIWREQQRSDEARWQEIEHRQRAEASFRSALAGAEQLRKVRADPRLQKGELEDLRRVLLEAEKNIYEHFVDLHADKPDFQMERARAYWLLGNVMLELGSTDAALSHYRQSIAILAKLVEEFPTVVEYRSALAANHNNAGELCRRTNRASEAEQAFKAAADLNRALVQENSTVPKYQADLAQNYSNLSLLYTETNRFADAEQAFANAVSLLQDLTRQQPAVPEYQAELARVYDNMGLCYRNAGQRRQADQSFRESLAILKNLVRDHPNTPSYRGTLAQNSSNLGAWYWETEQLADAESVLLEALPLLKDLTRDHRLIPRYQDILAKSYMNLGNVYKATKRMKEAEQAFKEALKIQEVLAREYPKHPRYQGDLALSFHNLANLYGDTNQTTAAEQAYLHAISIWHRLAESNPARPDYRFELALTHDSLGVLLMAMKQFPKAEEAFRKAILIRKKLVQDFPGRPDYRNNLAMTYNKLGVLAKDACKPQEAEDAYRQGLDIATKLAADFPAVSDYQHTIGIFLHNQAGLLADQGNWDRARQLWEQAIDHQQAALKLNPKSPTYRNLLRQHYSEYTDALVRLGKHGEAPKAAMQLPGLYPENGQEYYFAAQFLARCVPLAEKDSTRPEAERQKLVQTYSSRAIELLKEAIHKGYQDVKRLKQDKAFDPLRAREGFRRLLSELKAKTK